MKHTFIVYDEFGKAVFTMTGDDVPMLAGTAVIEIPEGKEVSHVDVDTGEVFLKDAEAKKTISQLEEELVAKEDYIAMLSLADAEV